MNEKDLKKAVDAGKQLQIRHIDGGWIDMHERDPFSIDPKYIRVKPVGTPVARVNLKMLHKALAAVTLPEPTYRGQTHHLMVADRVSDIKRQQLRLRPDDIAKYTTVTLTAVPYTNGVNSWLEWELVI